MTDEEKYAPENVSVDRQRTALAVEAWNTEAIRRAKDDLYYHLTGRTFLGLERDPNAAFIVGVMQKHFLNLSREKTVTVRLVPCIRENSPRAVGILSLREEELSSSGRESLLILRHICDDVSETEEPGEDDGGLRQRIRFTVHDVWESFELRGNAYAEWIRLTYGQ